MKIGTDAVLLGAWRPDNTPLSRVLEVGTGCGIIALMLAQYYHCQIIAIDIDPSSVVVAKQNFNYSPWKALLKAERVALKDFAQMFQGEFDCIISNPPFFSQSLKSISNQKNLARHADLGFTPEDLFRCSRIILKEKGSVRLIWPFDDFDRLKNAAFMHGFSLAVRQDVRPHVNKPLLRSLTCWKTNSSATQYLPELVITNLDESFSEQYNLMMKDYHPFL